MATWDEKKKYCTIIFDEMSLTPALHYNRIKGSITGFVELPERSNQFADHALVFLLRGAVHKWTQPIAYYFCEGATSGIQLKTILKNIVAAVAETGLIPLALVCDQGSAFQSAINSLKQESRRDQILSGINLGKYSQRSYFSSSVCFSKISRYSQHHSKLNTFWLLVRPYCVK